MKKILLIALASFFTTTISAQSQKIKNIRWLGEKKKSQIEFFETKELGLHAKVVWLYNSLDKNGLPVKDAKNPNQSLRNNPLIGTIVISGMKFEDGKWIAERLYSPNDGIIARGTITLLSDSTLAVKGTKFGISKTNIFSKVKKQ